MLASRFKCPGTADVGSAVVGHVAVIARSRVSISTGLQGSVKLQGRLLWQSKSAVLGNAGLQREASRSSWTSAAVGKLSDSRSVYVFGTETREVGGAGVPGALVSVPQQLQGTHFQRCLFPVQHLFLRPRPR